MSGPLWRVAKGRGDGPRAFATPEIARGTYVEGEAPAELLARAPDGRCPGCGGPVPRSRRAQPLGLEWPTTEPLTLGDFTWPVGSDHPVIHERLGTDLRERFGGFDPAPVEVLSERVRVDGRPGRRLPQRFLVEARGLVELWPRKICRPDGGRTTLRTIRPPCPECGLDSLFWGESSTLQIAMRGQSGLTVLEGVEYWESGQWDPVARDLSRTRHPRQDGRGLFVTAAELGDAGFFRLDRDQRYILCTDAAKRYIEAQGLTNVSFLEAGEITA